MPPAVQTASPPTSPAVSPKAASAGAANPAAGVQKAQPAATANTEPQPLPAAPEPKPKAQPEPEPPPSAPVREPVRTPPRAVQTVPAAYTPEALQKGIEGAVLLSVDIDDQGIPRRARILRSLDPGLDRKAVESLAGWRFAPATEEGKAVASTANVEIRFQLVGAPRRTPPSLKK